MKGSCASDSRSRGCRVPEKRPIEVLRRANAKQVAESDGKGTVAGKIEEQVERVGIHVGRDRQDARRRWRRDPSSIA